MNAWPPNPGFTDITSTKSSSPATSSSIDAGVDGLSTAPALAPSFLMLRERSMQVRHGFHVHRDHVRARRDERLDVAIGVLDHQVDVERHASPPA